MSSLLTWPSGVGRTGPTVANATLYGLFGQSYNLWVDSNSGTDSAGYGTEPEKPCASLRYALHTVRTGNDQIVWVAANHTEQWASTETNSATGITIIGLGSGSSKPQITNPNASNMLVVTGTGWHIENLAFPASTAAGGVRLNLQAVTAGNRTTVKDCDFTCGSNDAISIEMDDASANATACLSLSGCTFTSAAGSLTTQPTNAIRASYAISDLTLKDCTFSGGSYGWAGAAMNINAAATRLRATGITTDRLSDISVVTGSTGYIFGVAGTNSIAGRLIWPT